MYVWTHPNQLLLGFQCSNCGEPFAVTGNRDVVSVYHFTLWPNAESVDDGKFKCGDCFNERHKCRGCWKVIEGGMVVSAFGRDFHKQCLPTDADTSQTTLGECCVCKTPVKQGGVNAPRIGFMHEECFKCSDCNKPFGDEEPGIISGHMVCQDCGTARREAMADRCCTCDKPITCGPKLAFHQKYHPTCIKYGLSLLKKLTALGVISVRRI
jgi:hypothetical protein